MQHAHRGHTCSPFLLHSSRRCLPSCLPVTAEPYLQGRSALGVGPCVWGDPTSKARAGWDTSMEQDTMSGPQEIRMSSPGKAGPKTPRMARSQRAPEGQSCPGLALLHSPPGPPALSCPLCLPRPLHFPSSPSISRAFTICWTLKHVLKSLLFKSHCNFKNIATCSVAI